MGQATSHHHVFFASSMLLSVTHRSIPMGEQEHRDATEWQGTLPQFCPNTQE